MPTIYDAALDEWRNWETTPAQWLLLSGELPIIDSANQVWVADVAAWEVVVPSYTRQTATGQIRVVDTIAHRVTYTCDDPAWGVLDTDPPGIVAVVLAYTGADDTDSLLLAIYEIDMTGGGPVNPRIAPSGVHWVAQG